MNFVTAKITERKLLADLEQGANPKTTLQLSFTSDFFILKVYINPDKAQGNHQANPDLVNGIRIEMLHCILDVARFTPMEAPVVPGSRLLHHEQAERTGKYN